jgi:hypothetical protein
MPDYGLAPPYDRLVGRLVELLNPIWIEQQKPAGSSRLGPGPLLPIRHAGLGALGSKRADPLAALGVDLLQLGRPLEAPPEARAAGGARKLAFPGEPQTPMRSPGCFHASLRNVPSRPRVSRLRVSVPSDMGSTRMSR